MRIAEALRLILYRFGVACITMVLLRSLAPSTRRHANFVMEKPAKILRVFEADTKRDFLDGKQGLRQQIPRAGQANFEEIVIGAQAGVVGEGPPEPAVIDFELTREIGHVDAGLDRLAHADHGD